MNKPVVIYHPRFLEDYPTVQVECPDRIKVIYSELGRDYEIINPAPAQTADILKVHTQSLLDSVRREGDDVFEVALLAAGGAIKAAEEAVAGRPAFGLIRPPGHHASPDHYWGFCFFNNMAVSLAALLDRGAVNTALVLDFDLHFGDGTDNYFEGEDRVTVFNPGVVGARQDYMAEVHKTLAEIDSIDIIGVSAGFDIGEFDWGGLLTTSDFGEIGRLVRSTAERLCNGRRFALLEGGYYLPELGKNAAEFCSMFL